MYQIKKIPSPTGNLVELSNPVTVNFVKGDVDVYTEAGELRANVTNARDTDKKYNVFYTRHFNDGSTREFATQEIINRKNKTFSLSKSPLLGNKDKYVTSVDIVIEEIK